MTLRAVLAAQGNLKGQGMARRPMPCHFQFSSARQGGVHWLTYELGIQGQVPFPHPTYKALLAINFASRAFFVCRTQAGKRYLPLYSRILVWASRLVRCDLFRAAIKETRKEREGEEKLLRIGQ